MSQRRSDDASMKVMNAIFLSALFAAFIGIPHLGWELWQVLLGAGFAGAILGAVHSR